MAKAKLDEAIFKAYDIRGIYPSQIDEGTALAVGCAFGRYIGKGKKVAACMDVRLSSPSLHKNFLEGFSDSEPKLVDIGVAPTPVAYFAWNYYGFEAGVMITASHNPKEYNGFKFWDRKGWVSMESGLGKIKEMATSGTKCNSRKMNIEERHLQTLDDYGRFVLSKAKVKKGIKIAIDPGNGSYCNLARKILEKAGVEVVEINGSPDGNFPGRAPEPKQESLGELISIVTDGGLDFGIGYDADGDRGIFVDSRGRVLRGDFALAIFVANMLKGGSKVVYDVSCSDAVIDVVKKAGGVPVVTKVGRTYILAAMAREKAALGGEISGHMYFADAYYGDDPLFATMKMAGILSSKGKSLSQLVDELPRYETVALELHAEDSVKFRIVELLTKELSEQGDEVITIDGIKVVTGKGWFIMRASNTTPIIRLIAEAKSKKELDALVDYAKAKFEKAYNKLGR